MKKLICGLLLALLPAAAQGGVLVGRTKHISSMTFTFTGDMKLAVSTNTASTFTITLDGADGTIVADGAFTANGVNTDTLDISTAANAAEIVNLSLSTAANATDIAALTLATETIKLATNTWSGANVFVSSMTIDPTKARSICPSAFTEVRSSTTVDASLGCIQTAEEGTAAYGVAQSDCFDTYGGRLPMMGEWRIAVDNFSLTNEIDTSELLGDYGESPSNNFVSTCGGGAIENCGSNTFAASVDYRCFIPR